MALTGAMRAFRNFRQKSGERETTVFATIGGDFNCDNLSPSDQDVAGHEIFSAYSDVCMEEPGRDKPWAIGTELRQMKVSWPNFVSSRSFFLPFTFGNHRFTMT